MTDYQSNNNNKPGINWDEHAVYWDDYADARQYSKNTFETLKGLIDLNGLNILDFGCGTGILTEYMSPAAEQKE